jgi:threonine aldolase
VKRCVKLKSKWAWVKSNNNYTIAMLKYLFFNDYSEGVHESIVELLRTTNFQQEIGYGEDSFSQQAAELIKKELANPAAAVHFVSGGTQANLIVLASLLKPYESVIAAQTGHIAVHEAGAIEQTGHKINTVVSSDGKLTPDLIKTVVESHTDEHMVQPKVVFISYSTEVGTIYTKAELQVLFDYCRSHELYLYLDGARLGSGLMSSQADLTLADISQLTDVFYIGGTKNGALLGEAVVINTPQLQPNFRSYLKQHGALLAKGRLLGLQFVGLFTNRLFFDLAKHANDQAAALTAGLKAQGVTFLTESTTNQIFPILPNTVIQQLESLYGFYVWSKVDADHSAIRLVTSWATRPEKVTEFLADFSLYYKNL